MASKTLIALLAFAVCPLLYGNGNGSSADTAVINETQRLSTAGGDIGLQQYETSIRDRIKAADDGLFNANDISALPSDLRARLNAFLNSGWDPSELSSLSAWYRTASGEYTTETGVDQWTDKSGNGIHLLQTDTARQPSVVSAAINGHDAIKGDTTNDNLQSTATFALARPYHVFIVCQINTYNTSNYAILTTVNDATSGIDSWIPYSWTGGGGEVRITAPSGGDFGNTSAPATGTWFVFEGLWKSGTDASHIKIDNGSTQTGTLTTDPAATLTLGAFARADGTNPTDVAMAEIIICNDEVTGDDLTNLYDYFLTRYGL